MTTRFSTIDLTQLSAPQVIDALDYNTVIQARLDLVTQLWTAFQAQNPSLPNLDTLNLASEPITIVLQADAYRELLLRGEINDKAKALLLAYGTGSDLDQIGAAYDVARMVISPEDDTTVPPTPAVIATVGASPACRFRSTRSRRRRRRPRASCRSSAGRPRSTSGTRPGRTRSSAMSSPRRSAALQEGHRLRDRAVRPLGRQRRAAVGRDLAAPEIRKLARCSFVRKRRLGCEIIDSGNECFRKL